MNAPMFNVTKMKKLLKTTNNQEESGKCYKSHYDTKSFKLPNTINFQSKSTKHCKPGIAVTKNEKLPEITNHQKESHGNYKPVTKVQKLPLISKHLERSAGNSKKAKIVQKQKLPKILNPSGESVVNPKTNNSFKTQNVKKIVIQQRKSVKNSNAINKLEPIRGPVSQQVNPEILDDNFWEEPSPWEDQDTKEFLNCLDPDGTNSKDQNDQNLNQQSNSQENFPKCLRRNATFVCDRKIFGSSPFDNIDQKNAEDFGKHAQVDVFFLNKDKTNEKQADNSLSDMENTYHTTSKSESLLFPKKNSAQNNKGSYKEVCQLFGEWKKFYNLHEKFPCHKNQKKFDSYSNQSNYSLNSRLSNQSQMSRHSFTNSENIDGTLPANERVSSPCHRDENYLNMNKNYRKNGKSSKDSSVKSITEQISNMSEKKFDRYAISENSAERKKESLAKKEFDVYKERKRTVTYSVSLPCEKGLTTFKTIASKKLKNYSPRNVSHDLVNEFKTKPHKLTGDFETGPLLNALDDEENFHQNKRPTETYSVKTEAHMNNGESQTTENSYTYFNLGKSIKNGKPKVKVKDKAKNNSLGQQKQENMSETDYSLISGSDDELNNGFNSINIVENKESSKFLASKTSYEDVSSKPKKALRRNLNKNNSERKKITLSDPPTEILPKVINSPQVKVQPKPDKVALRNTDVQTPDFPFKPLLCSSPNKTYTTHNNSPLDVSYQPHVKKGHHRQVSQSLSTASEASKSTISAFLATADDEVTVSDKVNQWKAEVDVLTTMPSSKEKLKKFNAGTTMAETLYGAQGSEDFFATKQPQERKTIHKRESNATLLKMVSDAPPLQTPYTYPEPLQIMSGTSTCLPAIPPTTFIQNSAAQAPHTHFMQGSPFMAPPHATYLQNSVPQTSFIGDSDPLAPQPSIIPGSIPIPAQTSFPYGPSYPMYQPMVFAPHYLNGYGFMAPPPHSSMPVPPVQITEVYSSDDSLQSMATVRSQRSHGIQNYGLSLGSIENSIKNQNGMENNCGVATKQSQNAELLNDKAGKLPAGMMSSVNCNIKDEVLKKVEKVSSSGAANRSKFRSGSEMASILYGKVPATYKPSQKTARDIFCKELSNHNNRSHEVKQSVFNKPITAVKIKR